MKGTINNSALTSGNANFKVYLIDVVNSTPANMVFPVGHTADVSQTITPWTFTPSTGGDMALYSIGYSILYTNGSAAPSWIRYDDVANKIVIDKDLATTTGSYAFMLKGEILKSLVSTGKYRTKNFTVVVYSLIASTAVDQIYPI